MLIMIFKMFKRHGKYRIQQINGLSGYQVMSHALIRKLKLMGYPRFKTFEVACR